MNLPDSSMTESLAAIDVKKPLEMRAIHGRRRGMCCTKWFWVEASEAMEPYFREQNGCPLPNECIAFVLGRPEEKVEWLGDGFHYRRISGRSGKAETKIVFGFKSQTIANQALSQMDHAIKLHEFNSEALHESGNGP